MTRAEAYVSRVRELNPSVVVRQADYRDADAFVSLFNSNYKRKTSQEYFQWQFLDGPFPSKLFVAIERDQFIGFFGVKIMPTNSEMPAGFTVDLLIHDDWRKRGIAFLLEAEVRKYCEAKGVAFLAALPNAFGHAAFKALGWASIAKIDTLVHSSHSKDQGQSVVPATLPGEFGAKKLFQFQKNEDYLNWRFNRHPIYQYNKIDDGKGSYAVTKLFTDIDGRKFGDIVYLHGNGSAKRELLKMALDKMESINVRETTLWALKHTQTYFDAVQINFIPVEQERYFCVRPFGVENNLLLDVTNWELSECDSEIY
jgi:GNAT superfamily N-acetyltransferase